MRKHAKLVMLGLVAVLAMAFAATTAAAAPSEINSSEESIVATSKGRITFSASGIETECVVTLGGSIEATIENVEGEPAGSVTEGKVENCSSGEAETLFTGGSWGISVAEEVEYFPAEGGEPVEANLNMSNVQFKVTIGITCLYTGTVATALTGTNSSETTATAETVAILGQSVRKTGGSIFCPSTGSLAGEFGITSETLTLLP